MADRFPSIEDFDEGDTEVKNPAVPAAAGDSATEADFLARERAALGDDADQFTAPTAATVEEGDDDDLLGGGGDAIEQSSEQQQFESSFPSIDTGNEAVGPSGSITGTGIQSSYSAYAEPEEEPEPIKEWRERRNLALEHRAEQSTKKREATIKEAQQAIDDFYENYNNKKEKQIAQTQKDAEEFLANRDDTTAGGTSWERISKLVDLSGKGSKGGAAGTGKEKFRELLSDLRKDKEAPGSSGV